MASEADQLWFDRIKTRHAEASTDWSLVFDGGEECIAARLSPNAPPEVIVVTTQDCGFDDREFLLHAHADIGFLLRLLQYAFREIRNMRGAQQQQQKQQQQKKPADYAAECAMKCDDAVFRRFLAEARGFDIADRERIAVQVREALGVAKRSELNKDSEAAERWKSLRAEFEAWRRV